MKKKWIAAEHANDLRLDGRRWYVAVEDENGFHGQPTGGTMDEREAKRNAHCLNAELAKYRRDAAMADAQADAMAGY